MQLTISNNPTLGPALSGRQIQRLISVSSAKRDIFSDWFLARIKVLGLTENVDYLRSSVRLPGRSRKMTEYLVSVPAAIRIADYQQVGRGRNLSNYLRAYQQNPTAESVETTSAVSDLARPSEASPNGSDLFAGSAVPISDAVPGQARSAADPMPASGTDDQLSDATQARPVETPAGLTIPKTPAELLLEQATRLVEEEKKRAQQPTPTPFDSGLVMERLNALESQVGSLLTIFQQAGTLAKPVVVESVEADPATPPTTRTLLTRLVNNFAAADRKSEHETWRFLYGQFALRTSVDPYAQGAARSGSQSFLSVIESSGQIEQLYALAKRILVLPALK